MVFPIDLPPLRDRRDDIPQLVEHFLEKYARDAGRRVDRIQPEAMRRLQDHDWPGNVRELENVIHRAMLVTSEREITVGDLPPDLGGTQGRSGNDEQAGSAVEAVVSGDETLEDLERRAIEGALEQFGDNLSDAARRLGIGRSTLYRKIEQYGLKPKKD